MGHAGVLRAQRLAGALVLGALGCLPRDELSEYSRARPATASAEPEPSGADPGEGASPEGVVTPGEGAGIGDATLEPVAPDTRSAPSTTGDAPISEFGDAGSTDGGNADATLTSTDAGVPPDATCDALGGTLQPGTRDCLLIAGPPSPTLTWNAAAGACEDWGGALVTIRTPEREAFLTAATTTSAWIGARDVPQTNPAANTFRWESDGSLVDPGQHVNWSAGEPDDTPNQFCVEKRQEPPIDAWYDQPCQSLRHYVCERAL